MAKLTEKDLLRNILTPFQKDLAYCDLDITVSFNHVYNRLKERNISIVSFRQTLYDYINNHLCLMLYLTNLPEATRPYTINLVANDIIIVLARRPDNDLHWTIRTVLDPAIHNKYKDGPESTWKIDINLKEH